ncbi:CDP-alcohol phosphatidyltransferase family protein [bacterium]|nr:CDP-alcohol phosphatidyltransferase family protein [bacterium]
MPNKLISDTCKSRYHEATLPVVRFFLKLNIHPNVLTTLGLLISAAAGVCMAAGRLKGASILFLLAGLCDSLDGSLARTGGKTSKFGALYDSTLDRYAEIFFFLGTAWYFMQKEWSATTAAVFIALSGSMMVSYVRARAEGLNMDCKVGFLQRAERMILLSAGGLISPAALAAAVWIIAVFSNITAVHRIVHVWRAGRKTGPET